MTKYHYYGAIIAFIVIMVASGGMQYKDDLDAQSFKCKMIKEGTYPNVDKFYESNCK